MILKIQTGEKNPILRKRSQPIKKIDEKLLKLARDMIETTNINNGLGLSACQVGENIRMFIVLKELSDKNIFINPEIIKMSKKTDIIEEGCLSLSGIYLPTKRAKSLKIKAIDENDKEFKIKAKDLLARVIQHEIVHLNGVLITDHAED